MSDMVKKAAGHPSTIWVTLLAAVGAMLTGYAENRNAVGTVGAFCHESESGSYQALVDLRDKMDWIHSRVTTNEKKLAFATSPPGGPAQEVPPDPSETTEKAKEGEKPEEVAPVEEKKVEPKSVPLKEDGEIDWAPIERPTEQKGG